MAEDRFSVAVRDATALGFTIRLVEYCEDARTPGLLGAGRGVCDHTNKEIKLRAALAANPELLIDVLEHELKHARQEPGYERGTHRGVWWESENG